MTRKPRSHKDFMQLALTLASRGIGRTRPNPPVGAVVVKQGQVVGQGFHPRAGEPHAEVFALREAASSAHGADLYVTLEPCCHHGRTGPCTEAILSSGIRRVFVGTEDPNPLVRGKGLARLRAAGIKVVSGLLEAQCQALIAPFAKHTATGLPLVTLKAALTLDGFIATRNGDSRWISSPSSRARVHRLRDQVDGILVGLGTVLADNPRLTTRLEEGGGHNPSRIVLDTHLRIPEDAALFDSARRDGVHLFTCESPEHPKARRLGATGVAVHTVARDGEGVSLAAVCQTLGLAGFQHLRVAGGARTHASFLRAGLVDRVMLFVAPLLLGGDDGRRLFAGAGVEALDKAWRLGNVSVERIEDDVCIQGEMTGVHRTC